MPEHAVFHPTNLETNSRSPSSIEDCALEINSNNADAD
jgi:hypothetical protein